MGVESVSERGESSSGFVGKPSDQPPLQQTPEGPSAIEQIKEMASPLVGTHVDKGPAITHIYRLNIDNIRHLLMLGYAAIDTYEKTGAKFLGDLSKVASNISISSLNIATGATLVIAVIPNLIAKLAVISKYFGQRKQLEKIIKKQKEDIETIEKDLEKDPSDEHLLRKLQRSERELWKSEADMTTLKGAFIPALATSPNNIVEIAAGALRMTLHAMKLGGASSTTISHIAPAVPALGLAVGTFFAGYGGWMTVKSLKKLLSADKDLKKNKAELFLCDPANVTRLQEFASTNPGKNIKLLLTQEYARAKTTYERNKETSTTEPLEPPQPLTSEQWEAYQAATKAQKKTQETHDTPLASKCKALKKAFLQKKTEFLTLERKKQIVKVCHYALLTTIGVLSIAAAVTALVFSGGAATPIILVGIFVPLSLFGVGLLSTDIIAHKLDKMKEKLEIKGGITPKVKEVTGIRRLKDLISLRDEIWKECSGEDATLRNFLASNMGIDAATLTGLLSKDMVTDKKDSQSNGTQTKDKTDHPQITQTVLLSILTKHFDILFPKEKVEGIRNILATANLEHTTTSQKLAKDIKAIPEEQRRKLLKALGLPDKTEEKLAKLLKEKYPDLFPDKEKVLDLLSEYTIQVNIQGAKDPSKMAEAIAEKLFTEKENKNAIHLLMELGWSENSIPSLSKETLQQTLLQIFQKKPK